MITQRYSDVVNKELSEDAILNLEFQGFDLDYMVIHCLLRKHNIKTVFEIGCNYGTGTKIIKNAVGEDGVVFSLDLPTELIHASLQPSKDKKIDKVGSKCNLPFVLLRGDSIVFDFSKYPCEGYFVDGCHDYNHVFMETAKILKQNPIIIIYHDLHVPEVEQAINDVFNENIEYELFRVADTRIAYALKK